MAYDNTRSGLGHQNNSRGGVGQEARHITTAKIGRDRTYIPQRQQASKIGGRQGAEERRQEKPLIAELSYPDLFGHGEKERHVPDKETGKDLFVTLGLFPPAHDPKVRVRALKVTGAEDGHPLKSLSTTELVIEFKFLTNHTLSLEKRQSLDMKMVIQYLREYIAAVAGHVPNGKSR